MDKNAFEEFRKKQRLAYDESKPVWPNDLIENFKKVNISRQEVQSFIIKFKEYLRNKHSKEDTDYRENAEYLEAVKLARKMEKYEGLLFDLLLEIRKN